MISCASSGIGVELIGCVLEMVQSYLEVLGDGVRLFDIFWK